jgi:hypothetical protein
LSPQKENWTHSIAYPSRFRDIQYLLWANVREQAWHQAAKQQPTCYLLSETGTTRVFERIYSIEKYGGYNPMADYFLPLAFDDPAVMHAMLFSAGSIVLPSLKTNERLKALAHLRACIRMVNERLQSSPPIITDGTIAIVATVAFVEKSGGRHDNWAVHMQGLREMVRQRGGMCAFRSNRILYSKIQRTDLCGSLDAISEPYLADFPVKPGPADTELGQYHPQIPAFREIVSLTPFSHDFTHLLRRAELATAKLNALQAGNDKSGAVALRDEITSAEYDLLRLLLSNGDQVPFPTKLEHISRLGVLLYLLTIADDLPQGCSTCNMLTSKVRTELQHTTVAIPSGLMAWMALLVGMLTSDEKNLAWARRTMTMTMVVDAIASQGRERTHVRNVVKEFLWVEEIHGEGFNRVWGAPM